jgi:hypothetical protein
MSMAGCIFKGSVQYVEANVEEALDRVTIPPHLLFFGHALRDDLAESGFGEPCLCSFNCGQSVIA